jgi:hypothetical protein
LVKSTKAKLESEALKQVRWPASTTKRTSRSQTSHQGKESMENPKD